MATRYDVVATGIVRSPTETSGPQRCATVIASRKSASYSTRRSIRSTRTPQRVANDTPPMRKGCGSRATTSVGRTRMYTWNPRNALNTEVRALLEKALALLSDEETKSFFRERVRPRRPGKPL